MRRLLNSITRDPHASSRRRRSFVDFVPLSLGRAASSGTHRVGPRASCKERAKVGPLLYVSRRMARGMRVTRWDTVVFVRAALVAGLALGLAWLITAATDEGGVAWGERAGRTIPLTPICAAVGAWGALGPVRARGEVRALEALGRSLGQIAAAAIAGGAALALVAALAVGSSAAVDAAGFYPTALPPRAWRWEGNTFVDHARGLRVDAGGTPERFAPPVEARPRLTIPRGGRTAAALATAMAGLALPMLLAQLLLARPAAHGDRPAQNRSLGRTVWPVALTAATAVVASVMLFQAAAALLVPAVVAALPPAFLLAFALRRSRAQGRTR